MSKLVPILAAAAALASPGLARASDVAMRVQDVPLGPRSLAAAPAADALQHARGALDRRRRGALPHAPAARRVVGLDRRGRRCGAGRRHRLVARRQPRVDRRRRRLPVSAQRRRAAAARLRALVAGHHARRARRSREAGMPAIVPRSGWHAERGDRPRGADDSRLPFGWPSSTTPPAPTRTHRAQAAAIVRGIEVYHVQGNGWNDIGYNFLVDRFGTVYEGRAGGITRNVIGAHAEGFNSGTVGVALIGNFTNAKPPQAMQDALVKLLAWRLDVAHVDPLSRVVYTSGGNAKFKAGQVGDAAGDLGSPRHRPERVPRQRRLRAAAGDREARRADRAAEALLARPSRARSAARSASRPASRRRCRWTVTITDQLGSDGRVRERDAARSSTGRGARRPQARAASRGRSPLRARGRRRARSASGVRLPPPAFSLTNLATLPVVVAPAADGSRRHVDRHVHARRPGSRDGAGARPGRRAACSRCLQPSTRPARTASPGRPRRFPTAATCSP